MLQLAGILYIPFSPQSCLLSYYSSIRYHLLKVLKITDLIKDFFFHLQKVNYEYWTILWLSILSCRSWAFFSLFKKKGIKACYKQLTPSSDLRASFSVRRRVSSITPLAGWRFVGRLRKGLWYPVAPIPFIIPCFINNLEFSATEDWNEILVRFLRCILNALLVPKLHVM